MASQQVRLRDSSHRLGRTTGDGPTLGFPPGPRSERRVTRGRAARRSPFFCRSCGGRPLLGGGGGGAGGGGGGGERCWTRVAGSATAEGNLWKSRTSFGIVHLRGGVFGGIPRILRCSKGKAEGARGCAPSLTGRQATERGYAGPEATARATHYERRPWCSCTRNPCG